MSLSANAELWWSGIIRGLHDENLALHMRIKELEEERAELKKSLRKAQSTLQGMLDAAATESWGQ